MIAYPPKIDCPSCAAKRGQWCHDEERRICTTRAIRAAASVRDHASEATRMRALVAARRELAK